MRTELIGPEIEDPVLPLADPQEIMGRRLFGDSLGSDATQSDRSLHPKPLTRHQSKHCGGGFYYFVYLPQAVRLGYIQVTCIGL